jgi:hypothetical protein
VEEVLRNEIIFGVHYLTYMINFIVSIEAAKSGSGLLCNSDNVHQVEALLNELGHYFVVDRANKAAGEEKTAHEVFEAYDNPFFRTKSLSLEDFKGYVRGESLKQTRKCAAPRRGYQQCLDILSWETDTIQTVGSLAAFLEANGFSKNKQVDPGFCSACKTLALAAVKCEIYKRKHKPDGFTTQERIVVKPGEYTVPYVGMMTQLKVIMDTEKFGAVSDRIHSDSVSGLVCRLIISAFMAEMKDSKPQRKKLTLVVEAEKSAESSDEPSALICAMTHVLTSCKLTNVSSEWFNATKFAANKLENECTLFGGNPADTETSGEGPAGAGSGAGMQTLTKAAGSPVAVDTTHESAKATAMPQGESGSGSIRTTCAGAGAGAGVCVGGAGSGAGSDVGESVIEPMVQGCIEELSIPVLTDIANRCSSEANALGQAIPSLMMEIEEKISEVETNGAVVDLNKKNIDSARNEKIRAAMTAQWEKSSAELVVLQSELDKMKADLASMREQIEVLVKKHQLYATAAKRQHAANEALIASLKEPMEVRGADSSAPVVPVATAPVVPVESAHAEPVAPAPVSLAPMKPVGNWADSAEAEEAAADMSGGASGKPVAGAGAGASGAAGGKPVAKGAWDPSVVRGAASEPVPGPEKVPVPPSTRTENPDYEKKVARRIAQLATEYNTKLTKGFSALSVREKKTAKTTNLCDYLITELADAEAIKDYELAEMIKHFLATYETHMVPHWFEFKPWGYNSCFGPLKKWDGVDIADLQNALKIAQRGAATGLSVKNDLHAKLTAGHK